MADSVLSVHGGSIEDDCTDLVAKEENSIFKALYARSLKVRRCADLIFLNMRTQECKNGHPRGSKDQVYLAVACAYIAPARAPTVERKCILLFIVERKYCTWCLAWRIGL